jgi:fibronectin type 3 domain-containing protein
VESAPWLALSITGGSTTTETDQISASVNVQGLAAGTYNTMINVSASGASNSPQQIPLTITLSQPATTTGSLNLYWTGNTETDLTGYKVYVGTQPGIYNAPISIGNVTSYTVTNLPTGRTYYTSITAVDSAGNESLHSAEVSKTLN